MDGGPKQSYQNRRLEPQQIIKPLVCLVLGIISLLIVAGIGHYHKTQSELERLITRAIAETESAYNAAELRWRLREAFNTTRMREFLVELTSIPHVAGTSSADRITDYVHSVFSNLELDLVERKTYHDVSLSYPDAQEPNVVKIVIPSKKSVAYTCAGAMPALLPSEQPSSEMGVLWNAYAVNETASGELVYANYGRWEDFTYLQSRGIMVRGTIVIIREGRLWRGAKVIEAQLNGASGVLLYPDPADAAQEGGYPESTYPNKAWMPPAGARLGSLYMSHGDPFTPGFPAKNYTYRSWNVFELNASLVIPMIPVQPISYADAAVLMAGLGGTKAPLDWVGKLPGVHVYHIGPGFSGKRAASHKDSYANKDISANSSSRESRFGKRAIRASDEYTSNDIDVADGNNVKLSNSENFDGDNGATNTTSGENFSSESETSTQNTDNPLRVKTGTDREVPPVKYKGKPKAYVEHNPPLFNFPSPDIQELVFAKSNRVNMTVGNKRHNGTVVNIIAHIVGREHPDELVILGNHRDAWTYGSIDPHSGTALLLEIAVILSEARKEGNMKHSEHPSLVAKLLKQRTGSAYRRTEYIDEVWAPSRTLVLCSWDAEEFGQIGSTEWVEEHLGIVNARTVAYLNVDYALSGNVSLWAASTPLLYEALVASAACVDNPDPGEVAQGRLTVYDTWMHRNPAPSWGPMAFDPFLPIIDPPVADSDHWPFLQFAGTSVANFRYANLSQYEHPLHHTLYETLFLNEKILDPMDLNVSSAVGRFWLDLALRLSESTVLPMNVTHYANFIADGIRRYVNPALDHLLPSVNFGAASLNLNRAAQLLVKVAAHFDALRAAMSTVGPLGEEAAAQLFQTVMGSRAPQAARFPRTSKRDRYRTGSDTEREQRRLLISRINSRLIGFEQIWLASRAAPLPSSDRGLEHHMIFGTASNRDRHKWRLFPGVMTAVDEYLKQPAKPVGNRVAAEQDIRQQVSHLQWAIESAASWLQVNRRVQRTEFEYEDE